MTSALSAFAVAMPVLNGEAYLHEALESILLQSGEFDLSVHVQDGGSTDDTLNIVRDWASRPAREGTRFSWASGTDRGMYDAINKAFAILAPAPATWMAWLNADDLLARGAFAIVAEIAEAIPQARWIAGRTAVSSQAGLLRSIGDLEVFSPRTLAAGLHDGRALPFVMQEGVFWQASLWDEVAGLDERYRLAGDWDLWRRMARVSPLYAADTILGVHRKRPGQLSEDIARYWAEVDKALIGHRDEYEQARAESRAGELRPGWRAQRGLTGPTVRFDHAALTWKVSVNYGEPPGPPCILSNGKAAESIAVSWRSGVLRELTASHDLGMPPGHCWMTSDRAHGSFSTKKSGRHRLRAALRLYGAAADLTIAVGMLSVVTYSLTPRGNRQDFELTFDFDVAAGHHDIELKMTPTRVEARLAVVRIFIEAPP